MSNMLDVATVYVHLEHTAILSFCWEKNRTQTLKALFDWIASKFYLREISYCLWTENDDISHPNFITETSAFLLDRAWSVLFFKLNKNLIYTHMNSQEFLLKFYWRVHRPFKTWCVKDGKVYREEFLSDTHSVLFSSIDC